MIENSVVGLRCQIGRNVTIRNAVIMGADYYESPNDLAADRSSGRVPLGIGDNTVIDGAILDKNCRIGSNVRITNERGVENTDETPQGMVRDGIVVVPKDAELPHGWSLAGG